MYNANHKSEYLPLNPHSNKPVNGTIKNVFIYFIAQAFKKDTKNKKENTSPITA